MPDDIELTLTQLPLPEAAQELVDAGMAAAAGIDWFDFVPSDYQVVYTLLSALQRGRFCELGSGMGVVTGLAEMLGYEAFGIEIHQPLVDASRELLAKFGLKAKIELGDFFERDDPADLYFAYEWAGRLPRLQEHFHKNAPTGSRLIIFHGRRHIRWIEK